jgi:hypothetical protein
MIRDHFRGTKTFNLDAQEQISYAKITPYQYVEDAVSINQQCSEKIAEYEFLYGRKNVIGIKEFYNSDLSGLYGYQLMLSLSLPYTGFELLSPLFGEEPERLKMMREAGIEIFHHSAYFESDGTPKYFGVSARTKHLSIVPGMSDLENYDTIKQATVNHTGFFSCLYWFDLTDHNNFSIYVFDTMPECLRSYDVYNNTTVDDYRNQKLEFYKNFLDSGIISQIDYDFIVEQSPRMQQSALKYLWVNGSIVNREFETTCVYDFEDV